MNTRYFPLVASLSLALTIPPLSAHGLWQPSPGASLGLEVTTSYRNRGAADNALWNIPGVMMGGEAHGSEEGFELNSAVLDLSYFDDEQVYGIAEISTHDGHDDVTLEKAYIGTLWQRDMLQLQLEAGKMSAQFSPQHGKHTNARHFVDQPLAYEALYGGHFTDTGARVILSHAEGKGIGLEIFDGDAFPSTNDENPGAGDVFAYYHIAFDSMLFQNRIWYGRYEASNRVDDRLDSDSGHRHGDSDETLSYWFDGDTDITGIRTKAIWLGWQWAQIDLTAEYMQADIEGSVRDSTRLAKLDSEVKAMWAAIEVRRGIHTLAISYDHIKTDNTLFGDSGPALAPITGLAGMNDNPERLRFAYLQQWKESLKWSIELHSDHSSESEFEAILFALRWNGSWL